MNKANSAGILLTVAIAALSLAFPSQSVASGKKRFIFIDGGSYTGESIEAFKSTRLYKAHPWEIYAIEADPDFAAKIPRAQDVKVIVKAAWIRDGEIDFYRSLPGDTRSSLFYVPQYNKIKTRVPCFDLAKWLKDSFSRDDYVILSLDMAGAEFEVLEKIVADPAIEYLDRIYVEFSGEMYIGDKHPMKSTYAVMYALVEKIRDKGIIFDFDSAEDVIWNRDTWQDHL